MIKLGEKIKSLRKQKNISQEVFANYLGVSFQAVSKWENGNSVPDTEILTSLCQSLDISVNELLSGEKLPVETYPQRAEENMMNLLKENEDNRKNSTIQLVVGIALGILTYNPRYASSIIEKLLKSAIANAENNNGMNVDNLYIEECYANKGPTMKRIRPRAKGRAYRIEKRMSHITLVLNER